MENEKLLSQELALIDQLLDLVGSKEEYDCLVDRIGMPGTNLTFGDLTGNQKDSLILESSDAGSASNFLIEWLEEQIVFSLISGVGHRVVFGMKHTEPERITQKL